VWFVGLENFISEDLCVIGFKYAIQISLKKPPKFPKNEN